MIHTNYPLTQLNTFRVSAKTHYFAAIDSHEILKSLLADQQWQQQPKLVLGGGSNILFSRDYDGLVLHNEIKGVTKVDEDQAHVWLKIGAGENWHAVVMHCIANQYSGIENLSLIPGSVGAAPIQNIGAYGAELKDVFHELTAVDLETAETRTFDLQQCCFGYRSSIFKQEHKNRYMVLDVTLRLSKIFKPNITYDAIQSTLRQSNVNEITMKMVSDAVIQIRNLKLPDPSQLANAGSFFKNPIVMNSLYNQLKENHENIPSFSVGKDHTKIPAAWLIEQCGFKGKRVGDIGVYDKQSLVIVNYGESSGKVIEDFSKTIQLSVYETFTIQLQPEVVII